jgi:hypothetical protein
LSTAKDEGPNRTRPRHRDVHDRAEQQEDTCPHDDSANPVALLHAASLPVVPGPAYSGFSFRSLDAPVPKIAAAGVVQAVLSLNALFTRSSVDRPCDGLTKSEWQELSSCNGEIRMISTIARATGGMGSTV